MTTTPNAPDVDVLAAMKRKMSVESPVYVAVAELIIREAALVAERDALAAEVGALREAIGRLLWLHYPLTKARSDAHLIEFWEFQKKIGDEIADDFINAIMLLARTPAARAKAGT